ncbi:MAG: cytochrome c3 family protein [Chloroflexota bacterium]
MQERRRLGCISGTALIATTVTLAVITILALARGGLMFNPGELNAQPGETLGGVNTHASLAKECSRCHPAFWATSRMNDLCVECHSGISVQVAGTSGLHGAMLQKNQNIQCRECHPEHRGAQASLTELTSEGFPHEMLGYSLKGHAQRSDGQDFTCADCHADDITVFEAGACEDCHRQMDPVYTQTHLLWVGTGCLACHDGLDTYGSGFSHITTGYPLTGKHNEALCSACHLDARTSNDLKNTPRECSACHLKDDAHQSRFGQDCGQCHSPDGWTPATFDHDLSAFKLEGEHREVRCEECHVNDIYKGTPQACVDCHRGDDEHGGRFGDDCGACHNPSDWEEATFDHDRSNFPLTGAHARVECEECHVNETFKGTATACVSCHEDPLYHAGLFGTDCQSCHSTTAWQPAQYNASHPFPVNHEGAETCRDCHPSALDTWTCYTCHDQGETAREHREEGIGNFEDCLRCHPTGREEEGGD